MGEWPFWERGYRDPGAETFGPPSHEIVELSSRLPEGAPALDLGCGDGRNALALARGGLAVDALDVSRAGIRKLRARADDRGLSIRAWVQDIESYAFRRDYELVVAHGVLHLLARRAWERTLRSIRRHTRPGGRNVIAVFTDRLDPPADLEAHVGGLFREG